MADIYRSNRSLEKGLGGAQPQVPIESRFILVLVHIWMNPLAVGGP